MLTFFPDADRTVSGCRGTAARPIGTIKQMWALGKVASADRADPFRREGDREADALVGDIDRTPLLVLIAVEMKLASKSLPSPSPNGVHELVLRLLELGALRDPERVDRRRYRLSRLSLRGLRGAARQARCGREMPVRSRAMVAYSEPLTLGSEVRCGTGITAMARAPLVSSARR